MTAYDESTRSFVVSTTKKTDLSSRKPDLMKNADGSVDVYFGPTEPKGHEKNWVQTVPGKGWFAYFRFYAPKGFALDATHTPHITMLQCFVRTADLDKLYVAEEKVFAAANVNAMKLEAFKYYYAPAGATGVAGICAKPTSEILKLQADIIAAAKPFMVKTGPIGAFGVDPTVILVANSQGRLIGLNLGNMGKVSYGKIRSHSRFNRIRHQYHCWVYPNLGGTLKYARNEPSEKIAVLY